MATAISTSPCRTTLTGGGGTVATLFNRGNATFEAPVEYEAYYPTEIHAGDLNGDAMPDLVVNNSFYLNKGDGTFSRRMSYGAIGTCAALGDLDADGDLDIAVHQPLARLLHVVLGNGDGTFAPKVSYPTGEYPGSIQIGDLNNDGNQDIVVALVGLPETPAHAVDVLLGAGNGAFAPRFEQEVFLTKPSQIALGDLDGDGVLDLAVSSLSENALSVLNGKGDGTFGAATRYAVVGTWSLSIAIGDLNGDAKPDLAVTHGHYACVGVLRNKGDGTFGAETTFSTGNAPDGVTIRDLDGDARPDLIVANRDDATVSVLIQTP